MLISATDIISKSLSLYKENWQLFLRYAALFLIPAISLNVAAAFFIPEVLLGFPAIIDQSFWWYTIIGILLSILSVWFSIAFIQIVKQRYHKEPVKTLTQNLQSVKGLIVPAIIASIIVALIIMGGLLLLIVPGIIFAVWYTFVFYEVTLGDKKGMDALRASKAMVHGRWWEIFWRLAVPIVVFTIAAGIVTWLVTFPFPTAPGNLVSGTISSILSAAVSILFAPLSTAAATILFLEAKAHPVATKTKVKDLAP